MHELLEIEEKFPELKTADSPLSVSAVKSSMRLKRFSIKRRC